jgi:uncharacterized protein YwgA
MIADQDVAFILQLFSSVGGAIEGRKRLQKLVFILKEERGIPFSFSFQPYFYGPYSEDLTDLIETLVSSQFLREEEEEMWPGIVQYDYTLTEKGEILLRRLQQLPQLKAKLEEVRGNSIALNSLETRDLVAMSKRLMGMIPAISAV